MTLEQLVAISRGRRADEAKAREHLRERSRAALREQFAEYDLFAQSVAEVREPALLVGTAEDSAGRPVEVRLALEDLAAHGLITGATGSGKTSFATWLLINALRHGFPVGSIDCKAGFHELSLAWAGAVAYGLPLAERAAFVRRLAVVNPFGDALPPLNVCKVLPGGSAEIQAYDVALILSTLFDSAMGFQMENLLRHLLLLLMEADLSLAEAPLVLQDELVRGILVERSQSPLLKDFFYRVFPGVPSSSKDALLTRLQALILPENMRLMLGADQILDFKGILDRGDPLFAFLGMGPGCPAELVELLGTLVLQLLFSAATASRVGRRRPYVLIADEFFHLVDVPVLARRFEKGLSSLRAFGVHLMLVMHNFAQVPGSLREAILTNCDVMALFRTASRNAQHFGDFLPDNDPEAVMQALRRTGRPPGRHEVRGQLLERLQRLPDRQCYWYDRRKPHRAVLVRVPDVPEPHEAVGVPAHVLEEFIEVEKIRVGQAALPRDVLRRQIEARRERLRQLVNPPIEVIRPADGVDGPGSADARPAQRDGSRRPRLG